MRVQSGQRNVATLGRRLRFVVTGPRRASRENQSAVNKRDPRLELDDLGNSPHFGRRQIAIVLADLPSRAYADD